MIKEISFENGIIDEPVVIALGFFDCVHVGHIAIIEEAKRIAKEKHAALCVFTFNDCEKTTVKRFSDTVLTYSERVEKLDRLGVDYVLYARFDSEFMNMSGEEYFTFLIRNDIVSIVCGYDYTFGKNALYNAEKLQELCQTKSLRCKVVQKVEYNGKRVSTTLVKNALVNGDVRYVAELLGEPYFISGVVAEGRRVGRSLGFPTANIIPESVKLKIKFGVYKTYVVIDGVRYSCLTNYGNSPTYGTDVILAETYITGFSGDLYGKKLSVFFEEYLRDDKKFSSESELRLQLKKDLEYITNDQIRSER